MLATEGLFPPCQRLSLHTVQKRRFLVDSYSSPHTTHHARNDDIDIALTLCYTRFTTTKQGFTMNTRIIPLAASGAIVAAIAGFVIIDSLI